MEITQGIVDLYRISQVVIMPAESPRDTAEINMVLESTSGDLPYVFMVSLITEYSLDGDYDIVSFSRVSEQHSISYLARKALRNQCSQAVKGLFEAWRLLRRRG